LCLIKSPALQMRTYTQTGDDTIYPAFEFFQGGVIQMIPVVMGKEKKINLIGQNVDLIGIGGRKSFDAAGYGGGTLIENRIDQNTYAIHLQIIGRMAEPDQYIIIAHQLFYGRHIYRNLDPRNIPFIFDKTY